METRETFPNFLGVLTGLSRFSAHTRGRTKGASRLCSDLDFVVQSDLIAWHTADTPCVARCLEYGDLDVLRRDASRFRDAPVERADQRLFGFHRSPFEHADFNDDVAVGSVSRVDEIAPI